MGIGGVPPILLSIALLFVGLSGGGIWPARAAACDPFLSTVLFIIAGGIFLCGIAVCCSSDDNICVRCPAGIFYLLLSLLLAAFAVFAVVVSLDSGAQSVAQSGYIGKQYDLARYATWLRHRVGNHVVWTSIKSCIMKREECQRLVHATPDQMTGVIKFNDLQSGCCKPPDICGFIVINQSESTYARPPNATSSPTFAREPDCARFVEGEEKCFECDSCRAAFLETLRRRWKVMGGASFIIVALLLGGGGREEARRRRINRNQRNQR